MLQGFLPGQGTVSPMGQTGQRHRVLKGKRHNIIIVITIVEERRGEEKGIEEKRREGSPGWTIKETFTHAVYH